MLISFKSIKFRMRGQAPGMQRQQKFMPTLQVSFFMKEKAFFLFSYAIMMVYLCPDSCKQCEAYRHLPGSALKCRDYTPRCIRKDYRDQCTKDVSLIMQDVGQKW
jgi:hypothetical protein